MEVYEDVVRQVGIPISEEDRARLIAPYENKVWLDEELDVPDARESPAKRWRGEGYEVVTRLGTEKVDAA